MRPTGILALCDEYERSGALSHDAYWPEPIYHAMAEGKYLSTLAILRRTGAITQAEHEERVASATTRLQAANVTAVPDEAAWGLGFSYKGLDAAEPYLVTTSLIADGLLDAVSPATAELLKRAVAWLERYPWREEVAFEGGRLRLPWFSPNTPSVVTNVIARWARVLSRAAMAGYTSATPLPADAVRWILGCFAAPVGWPYTEGNRRVDLLHQCYILNALTGLVPDPEIEMRALRVISLFAHVDDFWDKLDIMDESAAVESCTRSSECSMFCTGSFWVLRYPQEARPWSYGELLVLLSRLAQVGGHAAYWKRLAGRVRAQIQAKFSLGLGKAPPSGRLGWRDAMHLAHGLAALFEFLQSAGGDGDTDGA